MKEHKNEIGILTFFRSENYGAVLQSFALRYSIQKKGGKAQLINYKIRYSKIPKLRKFIHLLWLYACVFWGRRRRINRINKFIVEYIGVDGKEYSSLYSIPEIKRYKKLIVGSDQVWNTDISNDACLRLDFACPGQEKYSYAASFGKSSLDENEKVMFKKSLSDFNAISVRELTAKKIVNDLGYKAECVLDPTLLLSGEEWKGVIENSSSVKHINDKYVFCYLLQGNNLNKTIISKAKSYAKKRNLKLVVVGQRDYYSLKFWDSTKYDNTSGPIEFLQYLYFAQCVFTNSFHGTCFSIIFQKQFYTFLKEGNERNSRILDLLSLLGLEGRCVYGNMIDPAPIDYGHVSKNLERQKAVSLLFLSRIISGHFPLMQ